ncbi:MAG: hypothetical protein F4089_14455 [Gammaproteobacteria bacterium]|nr:hypothetical protein [Gammaproteobacteria bacterium]
MPRSKRTAKAMREVAARLGLESVRMSYVEFVDQYMQVSVARDEPLTVLIDALDSSVSDLKAQGHFVSPHLVLEFLEREGITPVVDSRKPIDKMMVELWVTAVYALCLSDDYEYYVRPSRDDPPDTELLFVETKNNMVNVREVEVTQHGKFSAELTDVIAKKLRKRYAKGTVLLVLVEEAQDVRLADLYDFVEKHNAHGQEMVIIGGGDEAGEFKVLRWEEAATPGPDETSEMPIVGMQIPADVREIKKARCRYEGVVFEPPPMSAFRPQFPVFVRSVALRR